MEHKDVRVLLSAYLDGELEPAVLASVEKHLSTCAECSRSLETLRGLDESVKSTRPEEPPEGYFEFFPAKLRARIRSEDRGAASIGRMERRLARVRVGATVFVVLMAFGVGMMYGQRGLTVRRPRLSPISIGWRATAATRALNEKAETVGEEEPYESIDVVGSAVRDEMAEPVEESAYWGEPERRGVLPADVTEPAAAPEVAHKRAIAREKDAEGMLGTAPSISGLETEAKKKGVREDIVETYTMANVAQLQQDYDKALDGYARIVESSPGTELASAAQYQINVMKASSDTGEVVDRLRVSAQRWEVTPLA